MSAEKRGHRGLVLLAQGAEPPETPRKPFGVYPAGSVLGSIPVSPTRDAYPNADCETSKTAGQVTYQVVLMALEGSLAVEWLLIVESALTPALGRGCRC